MPGIGKVSCYTNFKITGEGPNGPITYSKTFDMPSELESALEQHISEGCLYVQAYGYKDGKRYYLYLAKGQVLRVGINDYTSTDE